MLEVYLVLVVAAVIVVTKLWPGATLRPRLFYLAILPELADFESHREFASAFRMAWRRVHGNDCEALLTVGFVAVWWVVFRRSIAWLSASLLLWLALFVVVPYLAGHVLCLWLFRERLRRDLRQQLAERGHAICVQCGYDLRGQTAPRCPECGRTVSGEKLNVKT